MNQLRVLNSRELKEINDFLDDLKDGTKHKKRLAEIESKKNEVNDLIKVYGKVSEIEELLGATIDSREQAEVFRIESKEDRDKTKIESTEMRRKAKLSADATLGRANEMFSDRERVLVAGEAEIGRLEKSLAKVSDALTVRENDVKEDMKKSVAIRTKYATAVASLEAAIRETQKAL